MIYILKVSIYFTLYVGVRLGLGKIHKMHAKARRIIRVRRAKNSRFSELLIGVLNGSSGFGLLYTY